MSFGMHVTRSVGHHVILGLDVYDKIQSQSIRISKIEKFPIHCFANSIIFLLVSKNNLTLRISTWATFVSGNNLSLRSFDQWLVNFFDWIKCDSI